MPVPSPTPLLRLSLSLAEWLICAVPTAIKFEHRTQDNTQDTGQRAQLDTKKRKEEAA